MTWRDEVGLPWRLYYEEDDDEDVDDEEQHFMG